MGPAGQLLLLAVRGPAHQDVVRSPGDVEDDGRVASGAGRRHHAYGAGAGLPRGAAGRDLGYLDREPETGPAAQQVEVEVAVEVPGGQPGRVGGGDAAVVE